MMNYKKLSEEKLREAASIGDLDTLRELISLGVDVNSKNAVNGWTALHWASYRGKAEVVDFLLINGADKTSLTHKGESPGDLSSSDLISQYLGEKHFPKVKEPLPIIPNYLSNPPFHYSKLLILVLKLGGHTMEVVEMKLSRFELTLWKLNEDSTKELYLGPDCIHKILKLPQTIIGSDGVVEGLMDFQEVLAFV